jgi:peptide/nickel transport system substrate-binding protein
MKELYKVMKKILLIFITVIIASGLLINGCTKEATKTSTPTTTSTPTVTGKMPVRGGTYTAISNLPLVSNVGYPREMPSNDASWWAETLAELSDLYGTLTPLLAESWKEDIKAKTLTVYLQKGVKFHDGTDFDAEAVK